MLPFPGPFPVFTFPCSTFGCGCSSDMPYSLSLKNGPSLSRFLQAAYSSLMRSELLCQPMLTQLLFWWVLLFPSTPDGANHDSANCEGQAIKACSYHVIFNMTTRWHSPHSIRRLWLTPTSLVLLGVLGPACDWTLEVAFSLHRFMKR